MTQTHDWKKTDKSWACSTCKAFLVPESAERFGMSWPPTDRDAVRLTDIEFKGPCWPKAPLAEQRLEHWKWSVAGQTLAARKQIAEMQRWSGDWTPEKVP